MAYIRRLRVNGTSYDIADSSRISQQIILAAGAWDSNNILSVQCPGVDTTNDIYVSPSPTSYKKYGSCGVICIAQGVNSLTFQCDTVPNVALYVNVLIFN